MRIPRRIFPFTFLITRQAVTSTPTRARRTVIPSEEKVPFRTEVLKEKRVTSVAPSTTTCAFCKPINVINKPNPTDTPSFKVGGIALKMASRTLVSDKRMKMMPSIKTAASAISQL